MPDKPEEPKLVAKASHFSKLTIPVLAASVVVLSVGIFMLLNNSKLRRENSGLTKQISAIEEENARLISESSAEPEVIYETYSEEMPNGKTISYPLTKENASIIWWYGGRSNEEFEPNGTYIYLTTTEIIHFYSEIDSDDIRTICNEVTEFGEWGIPLNRLNHFAITTETKKVSKGNGGLDCIGKISSPEFNKTGKYIDEAQLVLSQEREKIEAFAKSITVE